MKKALISLLLLICVSAAFAAPNAGDARSVLNAFISTFAKDNPAWKGDIVAITDPNNVPPGRQLGYSAVLGYYTFLPKTWDMLTEAERQQVYGDPRLKAFLVSLRNYNNYPSLTGTQTPRPAYPVYPVEGMQGGYYPNTSYAPYPPAYPQQGYAYPQVGYPVPGYQNQGYPQSYQAPQQQYQPQYQQQYSQPYQPYQQYQQQPQAYSSPAGYNYNPMQMSALPALVQPVTMYQPIPAQYSRLVVAPEEMLLDRPLRVYMQDGR